MSVYRRPQRSLMRFLARIICRLMQAGRLTGGSFLFAHETVAFDV